MIKFNVISIFPEMIESPLQQGVVGQAFKKQLIDVKVFNPRVHTEGVHQTVDDRPYGGGDGMVMMAEPMINTLKEVAGERTLGKVVYLSPKGKLWNQSMASKWCSELDVLTLICGRYGGIDQRIINQWVDEEISIGDYILSGGELAANILIDSISRFQVGVLGNELSCSRDSLGDGLLESPLFTRPQQVNQQFVPTVLLNGDHKKIEEFRKALSMLLTYAIRPDLWVSYCEGKDFIYNKEILSGFQQLDKLSRDELEVCGVSKQVLEAFCRVNQQQMSKAKG